MKTLAQLSKSLRPLAEAVYQECVAESGGKDLFVPDVAAKYAARIRAEGIDLNDHLGEFANKDMTALFRSKRKSLDYEQLWIGGLEWAIEELKSGVTSIGNKMYVTNYMLTWEHLEIRAAAQSDHIIAAEGELKKTRQLMDSDAGRMVKDTAGYVLGDAMVVLMTAAAADAA
jgi:hypothetical protein